MRDFIFTLACLVLLAYYGWLAGQGWQLWDRRVAAELAATHTR